VLVEVLVCGSDWFHRGRFAWCCIVCGWELHSSFCDAIVEVLVGSDWFHGGIFGRCDCGCCDGFRELVVLVDWFH